jgi:poly(A) polymerase
LLTWLLENKNALTDAQRQRWSRLQPILIAEGAPELVKLYAAKTTLGLADAADVEFCRAQLQRPREELDPPPLVNGQDLIALGIPRGPIFAKLLRQVRAAQLDGEINDRDFALQLAKQICDESA